MKSWVAFLLLIVFFLPVASAADRPGRWRALWHASEALLVAGNTADAATSWGKYETNPMLRTGSRFSYGSLAIKLGMVTGTIAVQHYVVRKSPNQVRYFAPANLAAAVAFGAIAAHNTTVPAARR